MERNRIYILFQAIRVCRFVSVHLHHTVHAYKGIDSSILEVPRVDNASQSKLPSPQHVAAVSWSHR